MLREIIFVALAFSAILFAALTISAKKVLRSALFFILTMLAASGIYLQLHAPGVFLAQWLVIACVFIGVAFLGAEVGKLDVAVADEYAWRPKAAFIAAAAVFLLETILYLLQRRYFPGEPLTVFLPRAAAAAPPGAGGTFRVFTNYDFLPLALVLFVAVFGTVGFRAMFQRRA